MWLTCQFGLAAPSLVLPREFRRLRVLSRPADDRRLRPAAQPRSQDPGPRRHRRSALGRVRRQRDAHSSRNSRRRASGGDRRVAVPPCCRQTRYAKLSLTTSTRTVGKATCSIATTMRVRRSHATIDSEGLDSFEKQLLLLQTIPGQGIGVRYRAWPRHRRVRFLHPLRRLVGRLSRQRQKRRQATQRTKPQGQPNAAQGVGVGVRTAPREPPTVNSKATIRRFRSAAERAIVATAHKLLRVVYCVLRTGKPYRDPETDYQAVKRNAPRWMLEMYNIAGRRRSPACQAATGGTDTGTKSTGAASATGGLSAAT